MKHKIDKEDVLNACIEKQQELIKSYTERVSDKKADAFSRTESASQSEDRRSGKLDILGALENELAFAQQELAYLKTLDAKTENDIVGPGALVLTNHLNFFIGVSSEKIEMGDNTIYGISTKAPIYAVMKNLKNGDSFRFNEREYKIEDLY